MTHTRERGRQAEERVATLLMQFEWSLLDRNWRCRWGELDLVLVKGRTAGHWDRNGLDALCRLAEALCENKEKMES